MYRGFGFIFLEPGCDIFGISGNWIGLYLEILSDFRALFEIFVDCGLIL
jgi:hypothetical protein